MPALFFEHKAPDWWMIRPAPTSQPTEPPLSPKGYAPHSAPPIENGVAPIL